jgi:hypothetical protein
MAENEIRFLGDLQRIERKPGDVFVLRVEQSISMQTHARLQEIWERVWTDTDVPIPKLLVLDSGMKIGVVALAQDPAT